MNDNLRLTIELVPKTSWFINLRNYTDKNWDAIRRIIYSYDGYLCAICGSPPPIHAHEVWHYEGGVQTLVDIISLCEDCHRVKHIGLAFTRGEGVRAIKHLMKINNINFREAQDYVRLSFATYTQRSLQNWELDLSQFDRIISEKENK